MADQNRNELTIVRVFDAPRELVWKAWTDEEMFKEWWGPKYFSAPAVKIDFKVGGKYLNVMRGPDGKEFWSTGTYKEIVPMERIVATDSFADEKGNIVPATYYGLGESFPMEMLLTVTFEEQDGKTKMTLIHSGTENISDKDLSNMEQGWNQSFDKLAESLK